MHPFMPFITEELWQRLPRVPSEKDIPSIMVAQYPQFSSSQNFSEAAEEYETVLR
jgi:valyl-tRNA synthetase